MVKGCLFCGGKLDYAGEYKSQHRYKCQACGKLQRSLELLKGSAKKTFASYEEPEVIEEVEEERDPDAEDNW